MKKYLLCAWIILLALLAGCGEKGEEPGAASPSVQVAYAAWQYDQGYQPAEGWVYEMELTAEAQTKELSALVDGASFAVIDQVFEYGKGYRIVFRDAEGNATREALLLDDGQATMEGMLYETEGTERLLQWLEALKIDEQEME